VREEWGRPASPARPLSPFSQEVSVAVAAYSAAQAEAPARRPSTSPTRSLSPHAEAFVANVFRRPSTQQSGIRPWTQESSGQAGPKSPRRPSTQASSRPRSPDPTDGPPPPWRRESPRARAAALRDTYSRLATPARSQGAARTLDDGLRLETTPVTSPFHPVMPPKRGGSVMPAAEWSPAAGCRPAALSRPASVLSPRRRLVAGQEDGYSFPPIDVRHLANLRDANMSCSRQGGGQPKRKGPRRPSATPQWNPEARPIPADVRMQYPQK
jgi:hypothetical protein